MICVFGHQRDAAQVRGIKKRKPGRTSFSAENNVNHSTQVVEQGANGAGGSESVVVRMMHGYKTS